MPTYIADRHIGTKSSDIGAPEKFVCHRQRKWPQMSSFACKQRSRRPYKLLGILSTHALKNRGLSNETHFYTPTFRIRGRTSEAQQFRAVLHDGAVKLEVKITNRSALSSNFRREFVQCCCRACMLYKCIFCYRRFFFNHFRTLHIERTA